MQFALASQTESSTGSLRLTCGFVINRLRLLTEEPIPAGILRPDPYKPDEGYGTHFYPAKPIPHPPNIAPSSIPNPDPSVTANMATGYSNFPNYSGLLYNIPGYSAFQPVNYLNKYTAPNPESPKPDYIPFTLTGAEENREPDEIIESREDSIFAHDQSSLGREENIYTQDQSSLGREENIYTQDQSALRREENMFTQDESLLRREEKIYTQDPSSLRRDENFFTRDQSSLRRDENIFPQDQSLLRRDENMYTQDQSSLRRDENIFAQDQSLLRREENMYTQDQSSLRRDENIFAQDQSLLRREENMYTQDQSSLRRDENIFAQDQSLLRREENIYTQDQSLLRRDENIFAQDQSLLRREDNMYTQDQSSLRRDENFFTRDQSSLRREEIDGVGQEVDTSHQQDFEDNFAIKIIPPSSNQDANINQLDAKMSIASLAQGSGGSVTIPSQINKDIKKKPERFSLITSIPFSKIDMKCVSSPVDTAFQNAIKRPIFNPAFHKDGERPKVEIQSNIVIKMATVSNETELKDKALIESLRHNKPLIPSTVQKHCSTTAAEVVNKNDNHFRLPEPKVDVLKETKHPQVTQPILIQRPILIPKDVTPVASQPSSMLRPIFNPAIAETSHMNSAQPTTTRPMFNPVSSEANNANLPQPAVIQMPAFNVVSSEANKPNSTQPSAVQKVMFNPVSSEASKTNLAQPAATQRPLFNPMSIDTNKSNFPSKPPEGGYNEQKNLVFLQNQKQAPKMLLTIQPNPQVILQRTTYESKNLQTPSRLSSQSKKNEVIADTTSKVVALKRLHQDNSDENDFENLITENQIYGNKIVVKEKSQAMQEEWKNKIKIEKPAEPAQPRPHEHWKNKLKREVKVDKPPESKGIIIQPNFVYLSNVQFPANLMMIKNSSKICQTTDSTKIIVSSNENKSTEVKTVNNNNIETNTVIKNDKPINVAIKKEPQVHLPKSNNNNNKTDVVFQTNQKVVVTPHVVPINKVPIIVTEADSKNKTIKEPKAPIVKKEPPKQVEVKPDKVIIACHVDVRVPKIVLANILPKVTTTANVIEEVSTLDLYEKRKRLRRLKYLSTASKEVPKAEPPAPKVISKPVINVITPDKMKAEILKEFKQTKEMRKEESSESDSDSDEDELDEYNGIIEKFGANYNANAKQDFLAKFCLATKEVIREKELERHERTLKFDAIASAYFTTRRQDPPLEDQSTPTPEPSRLEAVLEAEDSPSMKKKHQFLSRIKLMKVSPAYKADYEKAWRKIVRERNRRYGIPDPEPVNSDSELLNELTEINKSVTENNDLIKKRLDSISGENSDIRILAEKNFSELNRLSKMADRSVKMFSGKDTKKRDLTPGFDSENIKKTKIEPKDYPKLNIPSVSNIISLETDQELSPTVTPLSTLTQTTTQITMSTIQATMTTPQLTLTTPQATMTTKQATFNFKTTQSTMTTIQATMMTSQATMKTPHATMPTKQETFNLTTPQIIMTTPQATMTTKQDTFNFKTPLITMATPQATMTTPQATMTTKQDTFNFKTPLITMPTPQATMTTPQATMTTKQDTFKMPQITMTTPQATMTTKQDTFNFKTPQITMATPQATMTTPQATMTTPQATMTTKQDTFNFKTPLITMATPQATMTTPQVTMTHYDYDYEDTFKMPQITMTTPQATMATKQATFNFKIPLIPMMTSQTTMKTPQATMPTKQDTFKTPQITITTIQATMTAQMTMTRTQATMTMPQVTMKTPQVTMTTQMTKTRTQSTMTTPQATMKTPQVTMRRTQATMTTPQATMKTPQVTMTKTQATMTTQITMKTPQVTMTKTQATMTTLMTMTRTQSTMTTPQATMKTPQVTMTKTQATMTKIQATMTKTQATMTTQMTMKTPQATMTKAQATMTMPRTTMMSQATMTMRQVTSMDETTNSASSGLKEDVGCQADAKAFWEIVTDVMDDFIGNYRKYEIARKKEIDKLHNGNTRLKVKKAHTTRAVSRDTDRTRALLAERKLLTEDEAKLRTSLDRINRAIKAVKNC